SGVQKTLFASNDTMLLGTAWLPSSEALVVLFSNLELQFARNQIGTIDYPSGKFRAITADTNDYNNLSISSDGSTIATIMQQSERNLYVSGGAKADYSDAKLVPTDGAQGFVSWTKDGKILLENAPAISVMSADGGKIFTLPNLTSQPNGCADGHLIFVR